MNTMNVPVNGKVITLNSQMSVGQIAMAIAAAKRKAA